MGSSCEDLKGRVVSDPGLGCPSSGLGVGGGEKRGISVLPGMEAIERGALDSFWG